MSAPRLSPSEVAQLKHDHPISAVLDRMSIRPPRGWDGESEYRIPAAALGLPHGDDTSGVLIKPRENRWWAFHAGIGGDVLDLLRAAVGVTSLHEAARILETGQPIAITRPGADPATAEPRIESERPNPGRTPTGRVRAINAQAWRYLTLPGPAGAARAYLRGRSIDIAALEAEVGQPLAGHTPTSRTGLTDHLRRIGFHDDEILDAGWAVRRPGQPLRDRYRSRVLLPFRDEHGHVVGVTGRDTTSAATAKYLNHPHTVAFDKSTVLYRPTTQALDERATVIICEGTLDALAIAAAAARIGASHRYAPVSQSGLSFTDQVAPRVFALHPLPPVLCGDGDDAGQQATAAWAEKAIRVYHREVLTLTLPDGADPAEWLAQNGDLALLTFTRGGCLDDDTHVRPRPAGALLARRELARAMNTARTHHPDVETFMVAPIIVERLGALAAHLPTQVAAARFAAAAGDTLAALIDGLSPQARTDAVLNAARSNHERLRPAEDPTSSAELVGPLSM